MPMGLIKGKVIAKVFPWKEREWLENGLVPVVDAEE
jgi:inner membrane protease subunit 1